MDIPNSDETKLEGKAYHEAGHVIMQYLFGYKLEEVDIVETDSKGGVTSFRGKHQFHLQNEGVFYLGTPERDKYICHHIMISLAGEVSQEQFCRNLVKGYRAGYDRIDVQRLSKSLDPMWYSYPGELEARIENLRITTLQILTEEDVIGAVHAVAQALRDKKVLKGDEAISIIRNAIAQAVGGGKFKFQCPHCDEYEEYEE
ncbi:MAG: hypothetical protein NT118_13700 [Lentisphaerae bacterium]|nr:hypothetical protein [Lentisphaerota bacterium]